MAKARALANSLFGVISLVYPLLALVLLKFVEPYWVVAALLIALVLRLAFGGRGAPIIMIVASLVAIAGLSATAFFDSELAIRTYPVFMNAAMFAAFVSTLVRPPSLIERFARISDPDLPAEGVRYTRRVTEVWCGFLALNLLVSCWTVIQPSMLVWAVYNGGIAYALMGLLFAGEYLVRKSVMGKPPHPAGEKQP
ncbi:MAG: hypothetical protein GYB42_06125 [Alphaproteobacteria bacterium]|nr:hypothetical protein [Alphaproteobacteria bacterium]